MPYKRTRKGKVEWVVDVRMNGQRVTEIHKTKAEAQAREVEIRKALKEAKAKLRINTVSLLQWCNEYLDYCQGRVTPRVWQEKKDAFARFFEGLSAEMPVSEITPKLALDKLKRLARTKSGYSVNKDRKNLVAAWNWASKFLEGWPQCPNPFAQVPKFPYSKKPKYVPPMEDVEKIMELMSEKDKTMLLCFLHTGARRSEIFKLKWSDVDFANNQIWLTTRKRKGGMEERDPIPMTQELRQALLKLRAEHDGKHEHVFIGKYGKPYKDREDWLPRLCVKAGVKPFNYHSIRHLTASWLDAHNVPLTTIQRILRHRNPHTTARYLHELRGVQVCLDDVFGKKKAGKVLEFKKTKASNE